MKAHILIVDDEPDLREILAYNLESDGYEVICAESALEAQKAVDGNNIDLILLDVMMSPKSGFEWASELKGRKIFPLSSVQPRLWSTIFSRVSLLAPMTIYANRSESVR